MKRMMMVVGGGLLAASLSVGAYAQQDGHKGHDHSKESAEAKAVTVQGELIDTACFTASDGDAKGKDHAECATKCLGTGIPAAILPEGSKDATAMRFLLTNPVVLAPHAAKTIKVEGTEHASLHAIDVKKVYVQEGSNWKEVQLQDEHHKMASGTDAEKKDGHAGHGGQHGHK